MGLKSHFKWLADSVGRLFVKTSINPNVITLSSLGFALLAGYLISVSYVVEAAFFAFIAFVLDGFDGVIARAQKRATRFGAFLDGVVDRLVEMIILFSMLFLPWPDRNIALSSIVLLMSFGTFLTSFAKAYADHRGAVSRKDLSRMQCMLERIERTILIFISIIVYAASPVCSMYLLSVCAIFSLVSFLQRVWYVYKQGA